ncbi:MAG: glutamine--fructose-6-phosphate transaminase (isomerizing), partial [Bacteriovoracaceae bacterium]
MCGIVGHSGPGNSVEKVVEGLKRLEYRGYDSAGVCFKNTHDELVLIKRAGKLENLEKALVDVPLNSKICVGHTRWATHGVVNEANSHPHLNEKVAIVHNGIIENSTELKKELLDQGETFQSETDSEVFLVLISRALREGKELYEAIRESFLRIEGNSAFVIHHRDKGEIITIKKGAPIVCGINEQTKEVMVSSDPYALAGFVTKIFFPEDSVLCRLNPDRNELISFNELDGSLSSRYITKDLDQSFEAATKGQFPHYMLKEIYEQPVLVRGLLQYYREGEGAKTLERLRSFKPKKIHIVGCGTAYYAGMVIQGFIERILRVPTSVSYASEFRYSSPILDKQDLGIFISQSGETADTLAAQKLCKDAGIKTLSIVNVEGSTLFRQCDENLLINAGIEIGVASTKAFTQQCLTGRLLVSAWKKDNESDDLERKFSIFSHRLEGLLDRVPIIEAIAHEIHSFKGFLYTGRGKYFPVALEGALKLKEIAYVHAEGYASGELKHGPIALIDEEIVNIAIVGPELYEKTISNIEEIRARKGKIVSIGPKDDEGLKQISHFYIPLNFVGLGELSPLYVNVVNQLLAYYVAKSKV